MTDSGGIQEEAPVLAKPVLVLRDHTERLEAIEAGTALLAGTDETEIYALACRLLDDDGFYEQMARAKSPFGDGFASKRIADAAPNATFVLFEDGNHVCNDVPYRYRPLVADWLREQLR
jgi:UDP-N-acetylglucosamine 2-epimerase